MSGAYFVRPVWRRVAQSIIDPPLTSFALLPALRSLRVSLLTLSFLDVRLLVDFFATISLLLASSPARYPLSATCSRGQIRAVSDLVAT